MCDIKQEEEPSAGRKGTAERTERSGVTMDDILRNVTYKTEMPP